jgi:transposase
VSVGVETLFTSALGLVAPWEVAKVDLDTAKRRIDFEVRCNAKLLSCPHCNTPAQGIHDRLRRSWRHLDFFQFEAWLHADVPRVACTGCGKTTQVGVPWAREGSGFTALFEALALSLCRELPVRQAAALLRCADKPLWRRIEYYVQQARAVDDMSEVRTVGIDETSLRRGQHYITVVHDLAAKRLLFATEGRSHHSVLDFAQDLKAHGGDPAVVHHVCQDMSAAYTKGVGLALPAAAISYDRFHVVKMAIEAMDEVRRTEWRDQPHAVHAALGGTDRKVLKGLMWGMRKNPPAWSGQQISAMHWLQHSTLKSARGVAPEDGPARGLWRSAQAQRPQAGSGRSERLVELGHTLAAGALQETGQDLEDPLRWRDQRHAGQPIQCLRRSHERPVAAGQTRRTRLPNGRQLHRRRIPSHVQAGPSA